MFLYSTWFLWASEKSLSLLYHYVTQYHHWSAVYHYLHNIRWEQSSSVLSQKKKSYFRSDWPITVSDTHTPFHHWQLLWGEEMMYWWTEQHEQNRTYTHTQTLTACWSPQTELYPKLGACTQYYWQRCHQCTDWILVMTSALALILFHLSMLLTIIHWYKCIVDHTVNPGMDS